VDGTEGTRWEFVGVQAYLQMEGNRIQGTDNVLGFLFSNIDRPSVTELYLKFKEDDGKLNSNSAFPKPTNMKNAQLSVPNTGMIVKCCPKLKILKLGNWQGSNQALIAFWNGLGELWRKWNWRIVKTWRILRFMGKIEKVLTF